MPDDRISLQLRREEALVLFEWIAKLDSSRSIPWEDHAEEVVIWRLHAQLEEVLAEPFSPQYKELLAEARRRIRDSE